MMNGNYKHVFPGLCIIFFFFIAFTAVAGATMYYMLNEYQTTHAADAASAGDMIIIYNETFLSENLPNKNTDVTLLKKENNTKIIVDTVADFNYIYINNEGKWHPNNWGGNFGLIYYYGGSCTQSRDINTYHGCFGASLRLDYNVTEGFAGWYTKFQWSPTVTEKKGTLYVDDIQFVDTNNQYSTDKEFLDFVAEKAFMYFWETAQTAENTNNTSYGLIPDTTGNVGYATYDRKSSIAGNGFGLTALCIGAERGWISKSEAEERVYRTLLSHRNIQLKQSQNSSLGGKYGFFYHFLDINPGNRIENNGQRDSDITEVSSIDTALFIAGVITAGECFGYNESIKNLAEEIYNAVQWNKFFNSTLNQFYMGWKPEYKNDYTIPAPDGGYFTGNISMGWNGMWDIYTDETLLICLLAAGAPNESYRVSINDSFYSFNKRSWENCSYLIYPYPNGSKIISSWTGSLFTYFFAHCWWDFRNKEDSKAVNWWNNSVNAALANKYYCNEELKNKFQTYNNTNCWGVTACSGNCSYLEKVAKPCWCCNASCPISGQPSDEGTLAPYGAISCMPFFSSNESENPSFQSLKYYVEKSDQKLWNQYGPVDSFDLGTNSSCKVDWYAPGYLAIGVGPMLIGIHNYRAINDQNISSTYDWFMNNTHIKKVDNVTFKKTIYVPDDYVKIQWALDNATAGDTIIVKSGIYYENVNVTKQLILRGVDTGSGKPAVDASGIGSAITLSADGITLEGFKATNSGYYPNAGIKGTSNHTIITGNNVINSWDGIRLYSSSNNNITNNTACYNRYDGIALSSSSNNTITNNNVSSNNNGIRLSSSCNNNIYLNNFINNDGEIYSYDSSTIWNSTEKITYTYKGTTYVNYTGNYWDDYSGTDDNKDGIGDTPYSIDSDNDTYPLMLPFEDYFMPTGNVFDTGGPANPYPSIFGTHNGTITPNQTINVSKLYTYPCVGTGGHAESIELCKNNTLIANGTWNSYQGDYHNITLHNLTGGAPYVTLLKDHKYNYTIRTGSYPQIHHTPALLTNNGWINCTKFIDANGRVYYDWIPAIKLYA